MDGLNKERAFELLKKISFERVAGTDKELEAAHILEEECKKAGVPVVIEDFEIDTPEIYEAKLIVTKPEYVEIPCIGIGKSGNTPDEGVCGKLINAGAGLEADLLDAKGNIVLYTGMGPMGGPQGPQAMERVMKSGCAAYIAIGGSLYDPEEMVSELRTRNAFKKPGDDSNVPGVVIHINDAQRLLRMNPEEVKVVLKQDGEKKGTSHNVIATVEGSEVKDKCVVFSAHFDSVIYSSGAWDNGTGSVSIMELMHYFIKHQPKITCKFIWCGSEEIGLVGSRKYVEKHESEMKDTLFNINVDMIGTLLGYDIAACSCGKEIAEYINVLGKIEGFSINAKVDTYSSDSTSFVGAGVPSMSFARLAPRGGEEIHSRRDVIDHLDPQTFINTVEFMAKFAENIINAKVFPVTRELPKEIQESLERFKMFMGPGKKDDKKPPEGMMGEKKPEAPAK